MMKSLAALLCLAGIAFILPASMNTAGADDNIVTMSTTTSTEASGLLDHLLPAFKADTGISVRVMSKGTGAALRDGRDGNVDIVFVHDKTREKRFVNDGFGTRRYYVMFNDFVVIGPKSDPAKVRDAADAADAFRRIASARRPFVSRGDDSGTHSREKQLWDASGVSLNKNGAPADGDGWYYAIGQGMGAALIFALEKDGYVLSDRGTYLKYKYGRDTPYALELVYDGGDSLKNPYGAIPVNPDRFPWVRHDLAEKLAQWLVSEKGQKMIASYRLHGEVLFFPASR